MRDLKLEELGISPFNSINFDEADFSHAAPLEKKEDVKGHIQKVFQKFTTFIEAQQIIIDAIVAAADTNNMAVVKQNAHKLQNVYTQGVMEFGQFPIDVNKL
jgi:hypothetical protein